jgi:hypothetical protein
VPGAVGRTPVAVSGLADSGLVLRLTRGRLWIGLLTALLVGIVALNVLALSFSASSSKVGRQADALERANSALRARIADDIANERVQHAATRLGLIVPEPGAIRYLGTGANDAAIAARRLASGELTGLAAAPVATVPATSAPATTATSTDTTTATSTSTSTDTTAPPADTASAAGGQATATVTSGGDTASGGGVTPP